nr:carboxylating nicotinate-nucleotide diphosphorylase [candidate division Zixibacteria bacterium]
MNTIDELILKQVELALMEDVGPGDITTLACIDNAPGRAEIVAKSEGVLAGLPVAETVFLKLDDKIKFNSIKKDGESFGPGDKIAEIDGDYRAILTAERTALNILGHLSGIASLTARFVKEVAGTGAVILDTRKTMPGLRYLEKYAVTCGGGSNHRFGLYDMALIKDNHIAAAGSVTGAVQKMRAFLSGEEFSKRFEYDSAAVEIEVEVTEISQLTEAIECGIKRLLLDNQTAASLAEMVKTARGLDPSVKLEASGNVNLPNVRAIAETGVDFISIGALTHSAVSSDFSLRVITE